MARCQRYVYALVRDLQMFVREDVDGGAEAFRVFKRRRERDHALGAARPAACVHIYARCEVCVRVSRVVSVRISCAAVARVTARLRDPCAEMLSIPVSLFGEGVHDNDNAAQNS